MDDLTNSIHLDLDFVPRSEGSPAEARIYKRELDAILAAARGLDWR